MIAGGVITMPDHPTARIAIIGGGLTGTSAALRLAKANVLVDLYDWGRQPGGRTATRTVYIDDNLQEKFTPPGVQLKFNHGTQFIKTNDWEFMQSLRAAGAVEAETTQCSGWLSNGNFHPSDTTEASRLGVGFLGCLDNTTKTFVAATDTGMSGLCRNLQKMAIATSGRVRVFQQRRVVGVRRVTKTTSDVGVSCDAWVLDTDGGHHEQDASLLASMEGVSTEMPVYDAIIFTEHMMWLPSWHPCALRGLKETCPDAIQWVRRHLQYDHARRRFNRVAALFTLMVAFEGDGVGRDVGTVCIDDDQGILQYAVNQQSQKQFGETSTPAQCWCLFSTKEYAERCLAEEGMSRETTKTGEDQKETKGNEEMDAKDITYVPQEETYLRGSPADTMLKSFYRVLGLTSPSEEPTVLYNRCQRWGGAFTLAAPAAAAAHENLRFDGSVVNHGDSWELCCASSTPHVLSSGAGLWCAGDYIYPPSASVPSNVYQKASRTTPAMKQEDVAYVKALIMVHGNDFKSMAKDVKRNTRQLTMGRIEKLCSLHDARCLFEEQTNKAQHTSDSCAVVGEVGNHRHAERAWISGRNTAFRVLGSLLPASQRTLLPMECLEVCCGSIQSVAAALEGGCHRIELCSALSVGGLTPSLGFVRQVVALSKSKNIPINVLLRPREGDFCYNKIEVDIMLNDIEMMAREGVSGVVLGVLAPEGTIDVMATSTLIECARSHSLSVTFHRAIDVTEDPLSSLERCIELGVDRILTSGGAPTAMEGTDVLSKMVSRTISLPIIILAGGGLSETNVYDLVKSTGVYEVHGSLRSQQKHSMQFQNNKVKMGTESNEHVRLVCDVNRVKKTVATLHNTCSSGR